MTSRTSISLSCARYWQPASDLFDIDLRVRALAAFAGSDTAEHLAAANKRVANILAKADEADGNAPDPTLFSEPAEARYKKPSLMSGRPWCR